MAVIDTGTLDKEIIALLPQVFTAKSFLSKSGAGDVSRDVNTLYRNDPGFVHAIDENDNKPIVPISWTSYELQKKTLVGYTDRITKRQLKTQEGQQIARDLVAGLARTIPAAADVLTLAGVNPGDGTPLTVDSIESSTTLKVYQGTDSLLSVLDAAKAALPLATRGVMAVPAYGELANLRAEMTGQYIFPNASPDNFQYGTATVIVSPQVSWPGKEGVGTESNRLAVFGDFSVVRRAIDGIDIEWFNTGNPDGGANDLGRKNQYVARVETDYYWVITKANAFSVAYSGT